MESGGDGEKFSDTFDGTKKDCLKEVHRYNSISMAKTGQKERGEVTVVAAAMFAGKTNRAIWEAKRWERGGKRVLAFKHPLDDRYAGKSQLNTHDEITYPCIAESDLLEIYRQVVEKDAEVVIIDETQFYIGREKLFLAMVEQMAADGRMVVLVGLDLDFRGEPFGPMGALMAIADHVEKLKWVCANCGSVHAGRTQRMIGDKPANYDDELIQVGAEDSYQTRCSSCHEVPGKPTLDDLLALEGKQVN